MSLLFSATEIDSGRVVISGNWYSDDCMELFDGHSTFARIKEVAAKRSCPYILRTAKDNVMIFSSLDTKHTSGIRPDSIIVDQLWGEPFHAPLLDEWRPLAYDIPQMSELCFIGDEATGNYAYLLPVENAEGQIGFVKTRGTDFSLLSTTCAAPKVFQGDSIQYHFPVVDRQRGRGYLVGFSPSKRVYVLCVDYMEHLAPMTLYYTDPIPDFVDASPLITPKGNLLLTGGTGKKEDPSHNFYPLDNVFLFHFGSDEFVTSSSLSPTPWLIGTLLLITAAIICFYFYYRRQSKQKQTDAENEAKAPKTLDSKDVANAELMQRIHHLVVEEKQFLNSDLTVSDIAKQLGTHRNNISSCVNLIKDCNFTQYVNGYRIEYAKQLMRQHPDMKLNTVGLESGFANETSFYRTFKMITGKTPSEWKTTID